MILSLRQSATRFPILFQSKPKQTRMIQVSGDFLTQGWRMCSTRFKKKFAVFLVLFGVGWGVRGVCVGCAWGVRGVCVGCLLFFGSRRGDCWFVAAVLA